MELKRHVDATLGRGNVYEAVKLPEGEDIREWLAVNTVDLYNAVSVLYMTLAEFCTDETCKTMSAGPKVRSAFGLPDVYWPEHTLIANEQTALSVAKHAWHAVRVPLGGRRQGEKARKADGATVHRSPVRLDRGPGTPPRALYQACAYVCYRVCLHLRELG